MKPTQQQIEAATSAFFETTGGARKQIEAALTAAAEVGEQRIAHPAVKILAIADQCRLEIVKAVAAETERCAKKAESFGHRKWSSGDEIAAAIRKVE